MPRSLGPTEALLISALERLADGCLPFATGVEVTVLGSGTTALPSLGFGQSPDVLFMGAHVVLFQSTTRFIARREMLQRTLQLVHLSYSELKSNRCSEATSSHGVDRLE
jgi:hypothetical protein